MVALLVLWVCPSCWHSTASWPGVGGAQDDQGSSGRVSSKPPPTRLPPVHWRNLRPPCHRCSESGRGGRSHDSREGSRSLECQQRSSQQTAQGWNKKQLKVPSIIKTRILHMCTYIILKYNIIESEWPIRLNIAVTTCHCLLTALYHILQATVL